MRKYGLYMAEFAWRSMRMRKNAEWRDCAVWRVCALVKDFFPAPGAGAAGRAPAPAAGPAHPTL
eukprot:1306138-Alexandrium_andersonii.AAC.1